MQKYTCIITDDETIARELLQSYAEKIPWLEVVAMCANAMETQRALLTHEPDLLFLDIQMPDLTGLELLQLLKKQPITIVTTAYSEYALEGYEHNVIDYLLKPIEFERFFKAVTKASALLTSNTTDSSPSNQSKEYLFVKTDYKLQRINFEDILYIEALQKYVRFHTTEGRYVSLMGISSVLELLPADTFIRTHRSFIVSLKKIENVEGNMVRIAGKSIPISKGNKAAFLKALG